MNEPDDGLLSEATEEERAEADALRRYVEGRAPAPSTDLAGTVGLVREAGSVDAVARDMGWRSVRQRMRRDRAFWPIAVPAAFAAAAIIAFFLWPRAAVLPPGPSAEQFRAAIEVLSTSTPLPQRLGTLHELAGQARRRVVAQIALHEADPGSAAVARTAAHEAMLVETVSTGRDGAAVPAMMPALAMMPVRAQMPVLP